MDWISATLTIVKELFSGPVTGYVERKKAKLESDLRVNEAVTNAKVASAERGELHNNMMESKGIDNAGWKDEFWTIVLSIPLVMCWIPGLDGWVYDGFYILEDTPMWYQYCLGIAIGAPFGVRKIGDMITTWKQ